MSPWEGAARWAAASAPARICRVFDGLIMASTTPIDIAADTTGDALVLGH
jgi:hypothetical protein